MLNLHNVLAAHCVTMAELARDTGFSRSAISQISNRGVYPARVPRGVIEQAIRGTLEKKGIGGRELAGLFEEVAMPRANAAPPGVHTTSSGEENHEDRHMLIRKVSLNLRTLDHFGLARDPLVPPHERAQTFMGRALRTAYEHMMTTARFGGFIAIVGESGAGKTTMKDLIVDELRERGEVVVIEPMIIGMEENDRAGKTLKAANIADAILREVAPFEKPKRTLEARGVQIRDALAQATKDNPKRRHLLVIEEAHRLPVPTLKHLKNFYELRAGSRQLLSILLLGQPELARRLSPFDMAIREVWQRCEIVRLEPLGKQLPDYVAFRLGQAAQAIAPDALDALAQRLSDTASGGRSYLYPLAVDNWIAAALNLAAQVGAKKVTAETIDAAYTEISREYRDL